MGTLRSAVDHAGLVVNRVLLGSPARDVDESGEPCGLFYWDDGRLPDGLIDAEGLIVVDEQEVS